MIKQIILVLLLFILAFCFASEPKRLILLQRYGVKVWMTPEQVEKLIRPGEVIDFIDVTDVPENPIDLVTVAFPDQPKAQPIVKPLISQANSESEKAIKDFLTNYSTKYASRTCSSDMGVRAAQHLKDILTEIVNSLPADRRALFTIETIPTGSYKQPSLVARMKGQSKKVVIVGAHLDSVNCPGADDNGSGAAGVLELFRIISKSNYVPVKTLEFHLYACEEIGLVGSNVIASSYKKNNVDVYSMMNLDMISYFADDSIGIITNSVSSTLTAFVRKLAKEYCTLPTKDRTLSWGSSDHASWNRYGYHAAWPWEFKSNPDIHTSRDTVDKLNFKKTVEFIRLGLGYLIELSVDDA